MIGKRTRTQVEKIEDNGGENESNLKQAYAVASKTVAAGSVYRSVQVFLDICNTAEKNKYQCFALRQLYSFYFT